MLEVQKLKNGLTVELISQQINLLVNKVYQPDPALPFSPFFARIC